MSFRALSPIVLTWFATLVGVDILLVVVTIQGGGFDQGTGPLLDLWDMVKAAAIAFLLLIASSRARSTGLAIFGVMFLLIGILDGTRAHAHPARRLADLMPIEALLGIRPASALGVIELTVMLVIGAGMLGVILTVRDRWMPFSRVRTRLILFLVGLIVFAGFVDLVETLTRDHRWSIAEEARERLIFSITLAHSAVVFRISQRTPEVWSQRASSRD